MTRNNEVIAEKPFSEQWRHQALGILNWRSSSIHPSSYYNYYYVKIMFAHLQWKQSRAC